MLCKWNYTVCKLLGLAFFTPHNSMEIHPRCVYHQLVPFHCCLVFHSRDYHRSFTARPCKSIWVISSLGPSQIELLSAFLYRFLSFFFFFLPIYLFLCECKFLFLWDKYQGVSLLGHMVASCLVFFLLKEQPHCFLISTSLHSHQHHVRDQVFPHPYQRLVLSLFF